MNELSIQGNGMDDAGRYFQFQQILLSTSTYVNASIQFLRDDRTSYDAAVVDETVVASFA